MFRRSNSNQCRNLVMCVCKEIAMFVVHARFSFQNFRTLLFNFKSAYFFVYSRKRKFQLRMSQEYLRFIFGKNLKMLSLEEKIHHSHNKCVYLILLWALIF